MINDDAPVIRVEAGPGTGKTFGLVRRVLRILHPQGLNCAGKKVAVVAFNRVIAKQLSEEIKEELKKSPHDESPLIQTVHGFCLRLVGEEIRILLPHPPHQGREPRHPPTPPPIDRLQRVHVTQGQKREMNEARGR